tara:strand:+ start:91252 stop:91914 length:663 start_codon:yes stop_codon:yes gene_type:complete
MQNLERNSNEEIKSILGFFSIDKIELPEAMELAQSVVEDIKRPELFEARKYDKFSTEMILKYLRSSHEVYLSKKLPEIEQQLIHVHNKFPEYRLFHILYLFFKDYKNHLTSHIEHEENTVFRYIEYLLKANKEVSIVESIQILQGSPSLNHFLDEHTDTEQDLTAMRKVLNSDVEYKQLHPISMLLNQLSILENNLKVHAKLEDEVLLPKALELEAKLIS